MQVPTSGVLPTSQHQQPQTQQQQQQQAVQAPPTAPRRRCAEVCMDLLALESVRFFSSQQQEGPAAAVALDAMGIRVGRQLAERYTKDCPRMGETLEIIKFMCKDFWILVFKKQVDNLRTNHKGVFVLSDNNFRWLARLPPVSSAAGDPAKAELLREGALLHLHLPCGIVRGALTQLGITCSVEADPRSAPACAFTIRILS